MDHTVPSRRALIVDDEFLIAFDLESSMRELGFDVCNLASNEKEYLGGARTGIETARWLKEVCGIPIVFVTAYNDDSTLERIHDVVPGAPVLFKPVYRDTLAHAVSEAVH